MKPNQKDQENAQEILTQLTQQKKENQKEFLAKKLKEERNTIMNTLNTTLTIILLIGVVFIYITGNHIQKEIIVIETCNTEQIQQYEGTKEWQMNITNSVSEKNYNTHKLKESLKNLKPKD